jgi:hypothetical protein
MVSSVQIPRNQFGLIWSKLNPWVGHYLGPKLASWFSKSWALLWGHLFGSEPIDFPPKIVPCISFNLPLFGFGPSSKGQGLHLWLSANRIALFHWTSDLGPSSKVALIEQSPQHMICSYTPLWPTLGFALLDRTWVLCLCSFSRPPPLCWVLCLFKFARVWSEDFLLFPGDADTNTHIPISEKQWNNCKFCFVPDHVTWPCQVVWWARFQ